MTSAPEAPAYPPALLPKLQSLLAALADIDCAFDSDIGTVEASAIPDALKQAVLDSLRRRHRERRAPLLRRLEAVQRRILPGL